MKYLIEIVETETDEVIETMGPTYLRAAEKIERGVNINLNHEDYHTRIVEEE
jgi:AICAR transformylase/IMP cyclohydrolase PurH